MCGKESRMNSRGKSMAIVAALFAGACAQTPAAGRPRRRRPAGARAAGARGRVRRVGAGPTTAQTVSDRTDLLRQWGNAWALAGHTLPVDLTLAIQNVRQLQAQGDAPTEASMRQIDRYLAELALLDQDPAALGATRFTAHDVLEAGSWTTIEQVYTAGTHAPRRGAVFLVGLHFMSDEGRIQFEDPAGDNYTSARCSRAGAELEPFRMPWTSMHAGSGRSSPMMAFRLAGADLEPGDTVTFIYGDRGRRLARLRGADDVTRRLVLPVYVDLDGGGKFFSPAWDSLAGRRRARRWLRSTCSRRRWSRPASASRSRSGPPTVGSIGRPAPSRCGRSDSTARRWPTVPAGGRAIAEVTGLELRGSRASLDSRSDRPTADCPRAQPDLGAREGKRRDLLGRAPRPHRLRRGAGDARGVLRLRHRGCAARLHGADRARQPGSTPPSGGRSSAWRPPPTPTVA